jgi:hypothetical protein
VSVDLNQRFLVIVILVQTYLLSLVLTYLLSLVVTYLLSLEFDFVWAGNEVVRLLEGTNPNQKREIRKQIE